MNITGHKDRPKSRLIGILPAGKRIGKSAHQILRMAAVGEIEIELVDDKPKVVIASLERLQTNAR